MELYSQHYSALPQFEYYFQLFRGELNLDPDPSLNTPLPL
jgi:hypothetical protein